MDNHNNNLPLILNEKRVFIIRENIVKKDLVAKLVHSICAELPDLNEEEVLSSVLKRAIPVCEQIELQCHGDPLEWRNIFIRAL